VIYQYDLNLADSQAWEITVGLTPEQRRQPIVARLYQGPNDTEIRFVVLQPLGG
jgi:hypothetical protein